MLCSAPSMAAAVVEVQDDLYDPGKKMVVEIRVDASDILGSIKPMNAVNNGPAVKKPGGDQVRGNFEDYKAARIPFARAHVHRGSA